MRQIQALSVDDVLAAMPVFTSFFVVPPLLTQTHTHTHIYMYTYVVTLFPCYSMYSKLYNSNVLIDWVENVEVLWAKSQALRLDCLEQLCIHTCNELS